MKISITKIGAARSQLLEAIKLFFEERDPVSIHTLACASLEILNAHIKDIDVIYDKSLIFHYKSIYIRDESRKEWQYHLNRARNFFKHADRDLKNGILSLEFEPAFNEFIILEAVRCLYIVEEENYIPSIELQIFPLWFAINRPELVKENERDFFDNILSFEGLSIKNLHDCREIINIVHNHPELLNKTNNIK